CWESKKTKVVTRVERDVLCHHLRILYVWVISLAGYYVLPVLCFSLQRGGISSANALLRPSEEGV
ncbi:MAG: hypothetical protein K6C30_04195, partial [Bacteroidaceae bacterium]|nr:hypothetical protein [Bacteroidaceae bacterium]